jgi:hypothetical protein
MKTLLRRCDCDSIGQLEAIVNQSSSTNIAVRYLDSWNVVAAEYFKAINGPLNGMRQYQHFSFGSDESGIVNKS